MTEKFDDEDSGGNVHENLGRPNAERRKIKSGLVIEITKAIRSPGIRQVDAGEHMGLAQAKVSLMLRGQFSSVSARRNRCSLAHISTRHKKLILCIIMNFFGTSIRKEMRLAAATALVTFVIPVFGQAVTSFSPSMRRAPPNVISISATPLTAFVGVPQTVFINGCVRIGPTYYPTAYVAGTLTLQSFGIQSPCYNPIVAMELGPASPGVRRVIVNSPTGVIAEISSQVVVPAKATVDIDGMWYDDTSNGSGISFFQSPQTGQVLGTWFLYASGPIASAQSQQSQPPQDTPHWYSLQNTAWTSNGNVLEGTIFEAKADTGSERTPCVTGTDCPRRYYFLTPVGSFRLVVSEANRSRIETFDTTGATVFVSNLQRLLF